MIPSHPFSDITMDQSVLFGMRSFRDSLLLPDDLLRCSVPLWGVMAMLEGARAHGISQDELLQRLGVPGDLVDEDQWRVPLERMVRVLHWTSHRLRDEFVGLWSSPVPPGTFSLVIRQMLRCATVGEALVLGLRLYRLANPHFPLRLRVKGPLAWLDVPAAEGGIGSFDFMSPYWALCTVRWLAGRPVPSVAATVARPAMDYRYCEPQPFFEVPAVYGADATGVGIDAGWLHRPIARSLSDLPSFLHAAPANLVRSQSAPPAAAQQVRAQLEQRLREDNVANLPSLVSVACRLGMSPRALRRRLQSEGVSFLQLREDLLREVARQWVACTELPLADIGARLGFSDASTFHRAFKRWTGAAPGEYRRTH